MKTNKVVLIATVCIALILCGCSTESLDLPDLSGLGEINAVSREEGSGTRSEFESLTDTYETGADTIAMSTEEVIAAVSNDENAIGYVAYSSLDGLDGVKALSVDGKSPNSTTISRWEYALTREYILCWTGTLSDASTDFIRYIRSAGQEIVSLSATPILEATSFLSDLSSGTITIEGSSSVAPIMEALAEDYANYNPNVVIEITVSDSSEGINAALRGECDLGMSSRSLKSYEEELLETKAIAADGIAIIVNEANPLTELTLDMITGIYDGDYEYWTDLE